MPLNLTDDKSTLVQVMAWCRQILATIHDATSNMLNMQHVTPNLKDGIIETSPAVAIKRLKDHHLIKSPQPPPTQTAAVFNQLDTR